MERLESFGNFAAMNVETFLQYQNLQKTHEKPSALLIVQTFHGIIAHTANFLLSLHALV